MAWDLGQQKVFFIDWVPVYAGSLIPREKTERFIDGEGASPASLKGNRSTRELYSFAAPQGVRLVAEPCKKSAAWLKSEMPWKHSRIGLDTVVQDGGRYRLWYGALSKAFPATRAMTSAGIYVTPNRRMGTTGPNPAWGWFPIGAARTITSYSATIPVRILLSMAGASSLTLRPRQKNGTKLIYKDSSELVDLKTKKESMMRGAASPDGIHWKRIAEPVLPGYHSDTLTTAYYDPHLRCYVGYFRQWWGMRRGIARAATRDFRHWPQPTMVLLLDGPQRHSLARPLYQCARIVSEAGIR